VRKERDENLERKSVVVEVILGIHTAWPAMSGFGLYSALQLTDSLMLTAGLQTLLATPLPIYLKSTVEEKVQEIWEE
jgi:hypothetical protein